MPFDKAVDDLVSGETTFAIVGADQLITARALGEPVVAIAVIYQRNPWVYVSLKGSGIERVQDLVGKTIMVAPQAEGQHQALIRKLGIDPSSIDIAPYELDVTGLATGQIDAHLAYGTGLGLRFEEEGCDVNFIWLDDYGMRFYSDTIIATEQLVQQDPELVERFLRATLTGWRYTIENQAEAVGMILQYDPTADTDVQMRMMQMLIPIVHTGKAGIGWMDRSVWEEMYTMLWEKRVAASGTIEQRARDVAKQVEEYIRGHPGMTIEDLRNDPVFREIAIRQVGASGYTTLSDANTGIALVHPRRELENKVSHESVKATSLNESQSC